VKRLPQEVAALYREAVDTGEHDDFRELSGLLHFGAKERYRSVRATITRTVDGAVAEEANRRFVDWRFSKKGGFGMVRKDGGEWRRPPRGNFYRAYEDSEVVVRLWHERPDRWREEIRALDGRLLRCVVFGSARGPRWVYAPPETAIYDATFSEPWPHQDPFTDLSFALDPSEELFYYALLDDANVHKTDSRAIVAGRETVEVLVETVSWGHPPSIFHSSGASMEGTTDHVLLVDAEVGPILRVAARLEGREFRVAGVTEIAFGEEFPEGTFRLELPGVEFQPG
jgi:hypothetical protein